MEYCEYSQKDFNKHRFLNIIFTLAEDLKNND